MRTVKNLLASKAVPFNQVNSNTLVIDALKMIANINLSYLVIMDGEDFKGIFSEKDYSRNVILKGRHSDSTTVAEVVTPDIPIVGLAQTIEQCMILMNNHKTRYLLVFDEDEKFAGVITIHDLLRQVISNKEDVFDRTLAQKLIDDEEGRIY